MTSHKNLTCFKAYDVRGKLGEELNEEIAYRIGRAAAHSLNANTVVLGDVCIFRKKHTGTTPYYSDRIIPLGTDETCSDTNPPLIEIESVVDNTIVLDKHATLYYKLEPDDVLVDNGGLSITVNDIGGRTITTTDTTSFSNSYCIIS